MNSSDNLICSGISFLSCHDFSHSDAFQCMRASLFDRIKAFEASFLHLGSLESAVLYISALKLSFSNPFLLYYNGRLCWCIGFRSLASKPIHPGGASNFEITGMVFFGITILIFLSGYYFNISYCYIFRFLRFAESLRE